METYISVDRHCVICGERISPFTGPKNDIDTRKICDRCKKNMEHNKKLY